MSPLDVFPEFLFNAATFLALLSSSVSDEDEMRSGPSRFSYESHYDFCVVTGGFLTLSRRPVPAFPRSTPHWRV